MKFKEKSTVYTADGEKIGSVERVVMDPQTKEVTHLVVQQGFLFTEDKVLPIDLVDTTKEDSVFLRATDDEFDFSSLPKFEATHYVPLNATPDHELARPDAQDYRPVYWYPPVGQAYPGLPYAAYPEATYGTRVETQNIPEGTTALKEGAKVLSHDDTNVGSVEQVFMDPETARATHFVISQGLFLKEKKLVPTTWVWQVQEDTVHLGVTADFIDSLPEYEHA